MLEQERKNLSQEEIASFERDIEIYMMLSKLQPGDKYRMFDSSMFNDILKGYVKITADILIENAKDKDELEICREYGEQFIKTISNLLDVHSSEEAEYYSRRF